MDTKQRQSNLELCRLASISLIMLLHTTYAVLGPNVGFGVMLLEGFSVIGVNVFILLTGYFSASPKINSLINLCFICLFWMIVRIICRYALGETIDYTYAFFITKSNWFIASYIGLLFMTPILNAFCDSVDKKTLLGVVFVLLVLEIWFNWLPPWPKVRWGVQNGYSVLSFCILYLLARTIRLCGLPIWFKKFALLIYVLCSFIIAGLMYVMVNTGHNSPDAVQWLMAYVNPIVIIESVAFFSMFEQLKIQSRFINHVAKSTLAVLFGHVAILTIFCKQFLYIYGHFSGVYLVVYWALSIFLVFCASIAIDQIRILLYAPIEKIIKQKITQNEIFSK